MKKLLVLGLTGMLLTPILRFLGVGILVNPAVINQANCIASGITLGPIPDSFQVTIKDGYSFTLNRQQLTHAGHDHHHRIQHPGVGRDGILIAIMAALDRVHNSATRQHRHLPRVRDYPNDGNGSDHDSLGLFQMRPQSGWGTVAELMDPSFKRAPSTAGHDGPELSVSAGATR